MGEQNQHLDAIEDIKQLMHKSSRFISLSGLSGVAAGSCALIASWIAYNKIRQYGFHGRMDYNRARGTDIFNQSYRSLDIQLLLLALLTFVAALILAFLFTYIRSRKSGVSIWDRTGRRVMVNVAVPIIVGGLVIYRMMNFGYYGLIAPACLIFYGLGLINASKYTLQEIRYLGYCQLVLGILNLWMIGYGLYFWAAGFGLLHIIYGIIMWNKYERNN